MNLKYDLGLDCDEYIVGFMEQESLAISSANVDGLRTLYEQERKYWAEGYEVDDMHGAWSDALRARAGATYTFESKLIFAEMDKSKDFVEIARLVFIQAAFFRCLSLRSDVRNAVNSTVDEILEMYEVVGRNEDLLRESMAELESRAHESDTVKVAMSVRTIELGVLEQLFALLAENEISLLGEYDEDLEDLRDPGEAIMGRLRLLDQKIVELKRDIFDLEVEFEEKWAEATGAENAWAAKMNSIKVDLRAYDRYSAVLSGSESAQYVNNILKDNFLAKIIEKSRGGLMASLDRLELNILDFLKELKELIAQRASLTIAYSEMGAPADWLQNPASLSEYHVLAADADTDGAYFGPH